MRQPGGKDENARDFWGSLALRYEELAVQSVLRAPEWPLGQPVTVVAD